SLRSLYRRMRCIPFLRVLTSLVRRPLTLVCVCVGWVFFRATTVSDAFTMLRSMVTPSHPAMAGLALTPDLTPVLLVIGAALVVVSGWAWSGLRGTALPLWRHAKAGSVAILGTQLASRAALDPMLRACRQLRTSEAAALRTAAVRSVAYTLG